MNEQWKDIPSYEGCFQISNMGNIRSLDRIINSNHGTKRKNKGRVLKIQKDRQGYEKICLQCNNNQQTFKVHRLVAMAFLENKENKKTVNHINGIKNDNRLENLEWATYSENMQHSYDAGLRKNSSLFKKIRCVELDIETNSIIEMAYILEKEYDIKRKNVNTIATNISNNLIRRSKSAYGYTFKYVENINE